MSTTGTGHGPASAPSARRPAMLALLGALGDLLIVPLAGAWRLLGLGAAVVAQAVRPTAWRRTVRDEFFRHCHEVGLAALPAVLVLALLVGLGLVLQALYWLGVFGQSGVVGQLLVAVLVRELAPLVVGVLVIGRSLTVHVTELHELAESGKLATLDALGIDPFHLLVMPRVLAVSLCCFCLNTVFLAAALATGYVGASTAGLTSLSFASFMGEVLDSMGVAEFASSAAKPLLIGLLVGLVACAVPLAPANESLPLRTLLPRTFVAAMSALLVVSVTVTAAL